MCFMDNEFVFEGLIVLKVFEGKKFFEIGIWVLDLESIIICCVIFRNENLKELIVEIFFCLNKGVVELFDQEIWYVLFLGDFDKFFFEFVEIKEIKRFK